VPVGPTKEPAPPHGTANGKKLPQGMELGTIQEKDGHPAINFKEEQKRGKKISGTPRA